MNIYSLKKLYLKLLATTLILSFYINPVNASGLPPTVNCSTGSFTITSNVLTGHTLCTGEAIIPEGVISIGDNAFQNNTALTSVTIPNSVRTIGASAFAGNSDLEFVSIGNSVTSIGVNAFSGNIALTSVTIPASVTSIGVNAFSGNTALNSVTFLGNTPPTVGANAFLGVPAGTKANVLYSATGFPDDGSPWNSLVIRRIAIANCSTSGYITIYSNIVTESTVDCAGAVNIPSGVVKIEGGTFLYRPITSVTIPNTVTEIGSDAFESTELVSVIIPDSVTLLGGYVFRGTSTLTSVTIGNRVTSIGDDAFNGTRLTSVTIPNSVTEIGNRAFAGVSTLTSVTIGNGVTSIGANAFQGDTTLTSVIFLGNAPATFADAFSGVPTGAKANVAYNATGFPANGSDWRGLVISYGSAPSTESGSSKASVTTPILVKTADASFKLTNRKYLSKFEIRKAITKGRSFKRKPQDIYKFSISKASKRYCVMSGNYVMRLKKNGVCEITVTRTTNKDVMSKYQVKINYNN